MADDKTKAFRKMTAEEVQGLLHFRKRGGAVKPKKGKGAPYDRKKFKKGDED